MPHVRAHERDFSHEGWLRTEFPKKSKRKQITFGTDRVCIYCPREIPTFFSSFYSARATYRSRIPKTSSRRRITCSSRSLRRTFDDRPTSPIRLFLFLVFFFGVAREGQTVCVRVCVCVCDTERICFIEYCNLIASVNIRALVLARCSDDLRIENLGFLSDRLFFFLAHFSLVLEDLSVREVIA